MNQEPEQLDLPLPTPKVFRLRDLPAPIDREGVEGLTEALDVVAKGEAYGVAVIMLRPGVGETDTFISEGFKEHLILGLGSVSVLEMDVKSHMDKIR